MKKYICDIGIFLGWSGVFLTLGGGLVENWWIFFGGFPLMVLGMTLSGVDL